MNSNVITQASSDLVTNCHHACARRGSRAATAGYTITEVMVAVGICGIVFGAVLSGMSACTAVLQTARQNLRATQILQEKTETVRLYNWEQVNTPGFIPTKFEATADPVKKDSPILYHGTVSITNVPSSETYSTNMRMMVVEVTWGPKGAEHHRKMETLISRYGLQNYVY